MKSFLLALVLVAGCAAFADSVGQQSTPSFAQVVNQYFSQWDSNGDGILSKDEIEAAMASPKVHDEAAAAIAAIELVVRGSKYTLPPITKDYLVNSPLREPSATDEQTDSADDVSKPEKFNHQPAFQPRYLYAVRKLHSTSRNLFPQSFPSFDATHQGKMGDCPFVSTVGAMVYRDPSALKAMFTPGNNGTTKVSFGDGRSITIAHVTDADIAIWSSAGSNGLWLTVLEKAYRRILAETEHPDRKDRPNIYEKFASSHTIEILDGHETHKVELRETQLAGLRKRLNAAQRERRLMKAGTGAGKKIPGIPHRHAFAILGFDKETDIVHVWNPWGNNFTPKGADGLQNGYTTKTGEFDIPLKDLLQVFNDIDFETQTPDRN